MKKINESFTCVHCGENVKELSGSCRNHCNFCLHSLHVDLETPGDRRCACHGLMIPGRLEYKSKKQYIIVHHCSRCNQEKMNKVAGDDNWDLVIQLSQAGL